MIICLSCDKFNIFLHIGIENKIRVRSFTANGRSFDPNSNLIGISGAYDLSMSSQNMVDI